MKFTLNIFLAILFFSLFLELRANCVNGTSLHCLLRANESGTCNSDQVIEHQIELGAIFDDVSCELVKKLSVGSLANFTADEIIKLPTNLLYFLSINKLRTLSGAHLASLLIVHENDTSIAIKILMSTITIQQRTEFLNCLTTKVITNNKILDIIGETVYKWNYDVLDGKFQKLSNICGYALARLWAPYILTRTNSITNRLLHLLTESVEKPNHRSLCNKYTQVEWKSLPKNVRKLWAFLAVNQSFPSSLNEWTVKQIAQYKFWLPDFSNDELHRILFDEQSKMELHDIDFDNSQVRFLFSWLMENNTLKDVMIHYPSFFFKLSPLQINQFEPEEWANEKAAISSLDNTYLSYAAAKQIFNKIASDWLSSKTNVINGWTSKDLRHLPLLYTQPATSFLKFCSTPPSIQSLIAIDSYMLTDRQAFYLSGCSSALSFHKNDPKLLLGLKYIIKAVPISSLLNIEPGSINYQVVSHLVSLINDHNLPMAFHLLNIANPVKKNYFIEEMLKNKYNILFEQLAPLDIPGPIFDVLKQLYSNYTERIDDLPKHILSLILESNELRTKWIGNGSEITKGLYNGYTCNFIKTLNSVNFIVSISKYITYLKQNGKVFPKNLQVCVAEAFITYLKLKSKFQVDVPTMLHIETWEIEAVQGFVLTTLPIDVIFNSTLRDNIIYSIGQLSLPELMVACNPEKLPLLVSEYTTLILQNRSYISYEHLYILGNLVHFIPTAHLSSVDAHAFKLLINSGLFDTRMCVDLMSKHKWADLIIKAYGNLEKWSSDTLVTLTDFLIVLNQDQLNSIPNISRLNSADIIHTRYGYKIEWLPHNIPFYEACKLFLGDKNIHFTDSLSVLIDFYLISIQNQLQMISPISDNHQYEEIIKSSEAKSNVIKPSVLIPVPEFDNVLSMLSPSNLINKFFAGKEKQDASKNNFQVTSPSTKKFISPFVTSQNIEIVTKLPSILEVQNFSTINSQISALNVSEYNQNSSNLEIEQYPETSFHEKPLTIGDNINVLNLQGKTTSLPLNTNEKFEYVEHNFTISPLELKNRKKFYNIKNYEYKDISNDSHSSESIEILPIGSTNQNHDKRKKRSLELFFISDVQIGCEALRILGSVSVASMKFNSIVYSFSNEELEECIDLLGSFNISLELARHIWSKTKDKTALHTYGSVLSGLSIDDIKTINLEINYPWSLELINLLSEHIKINSIRKEITKQFMTKSKLGMPSHLWGSLGSMICQLQPRTLKIIMPNKELFWKTSSAFNAIKTCDTPCIKNLASIAVSVIGQSNLWKTAEVERMGIILSGVNITQWQLLLNFNQEALEGLSPIAVQCLDEPQIKLLNVTHIKHLSPKSVHTLWKNHFKLLEPQSKAILLKLIHFEIELDWNSTSAVIPVNADAHKHITDNNSKTASIYAFESINHISSNEMQADAKATTNYTLPFSIWSAVILLFILQ